MSKPNRVPVVVTTGKPLTTTDTQSIDPLSTLVENAVERVLERRWDDLLETLGERQIPKYLDSSGVCRMLSISPPTLRRLVDEGLPVVRLGEVRRYDLEQVREWLSSREGVS